MSSPSRGSRRFGNPHSFEDRVIAWLTATYHVTAPADRVEARARALALEQSVECPLEAIGDQRVLDEIVAQVGEITELGPERFRVDIRLAVETIGGDTAQFVNMLFGNASIWDDVEFVDVALPDTLLGGFAGPRHGTAGIRGLIGAAERPLTQVALKPQGLPVPDLAAMARTFALAGIDIIKDDHGIVDQRYSPFAERVPAIQAAVTAAAASTGRTALYAPNVSGAPREMHARARLALEAGCRVVLVAPMLVGLPAFGELVDAFPDLVYLAHPSFGGATRIAAPLLYGKLMRLYGADAVIFVNYGGRFAWAPETCASLAANLRAEWRHVRPAMPVPAGGMQLERVDELLEFYGPDCMLLIGGNLLIARERLLERSREFVRAVEGHAFPDVEGHGMPQDPAPFPADELRAAAAHDDARSAVDALHAELSSGSPDPTRIEGHVERLRGWDNLVAGLERWYLDPRTQLFMSDLNSTGL